MPKIANSSKHLRYLFYGTDDHPSGAKIPSDDVAMDKVERLTFGDKGPIR